MPVFTFLLGPLVGAVIGGITNRLAIMMLFRPYQAKHIGSLRVPLTPGIIPKEKPNIAHAIGNTVSQYLLDPESLSSKLLSDDMEAKVSSSVDNFTLHLQHSQSTLREFLLNHLSPDTFEQILSQMQDGATDAICAKLTDKALGEKVASLAIDQVMLRLNENILGKLGAGVLQLIRDSVERRLADNINDIMQNNSHQLVSDLLTSQVDTLLSKTLAELCQGKEDLFAQLKASTLTAYRNLIKNNLPKMLSAINIQKIIEDKINALDMKQTEAMLLQLMDRELKALVWFGVLLGFVMGFITNII